MSAGLAVGGMQWTSDNSLNNTQKHEQDGDDGHEDEQEVLRVGWWSVHGYLLMWAASMAAWWLKTGTALLLCRVVIPMQSVPV
jgi:hypothetical protein